MAAIKVLAFLNAFSQGISGGDQEFINNSKRIDSNVELTIVTSRLGVALCRSNNIKANYIVTTGEDFFSKPIFTYIKRTFLAIIKTSNLKVNEVWATSDFIPDVLPCFFIKLFHPSVTWRQNIFHLIPDSRKISSFFQKVSFILIKLSDRVILDNKPLKDYFVTKFHYQPNKLEVKQLFVDYETIHKLAASEKKYTAIFFGQLRQSKGIFDLVDIWSQVVSVHKNATLAFIGGDVSDNLSKLQKLTKEKKLNKNIIFLGHQPALTAFSYIKSSSMVIIPSYEEGFGLSVRESLACGKPVVVYDLPAFSDINDINLHRVPLGDKLLMSGKIIDLINKP